MKISSKDSVAFETTKKFWLSKVFQINFKSVCWFYWKLKALNFIGMKPFVIYQLDTFEILCIFGSVRLNYSPKLSTYNPNTSSKAATKFFCNNSEVTPYCYEAENVKWNESISFNTLSNIFLLIFLKYFFFSFEMFTKRMQVLQR